MWKPSVDFTAATLYTDGFTIISIEPTKALDWTGLVKPFDVLTWSCLLLSFPICSVVLYCLRRFARYPDKRATLNDSFWDIAIILLWDSIRSLNPSSGIILVLFLYLLLSQLMIGLYLGEFTGFLVNPKYVKPPMETIDQWRFNTTMSWIECEKSSTEHLRNYTFKDKPDILKRYANCSEYGGDYGRVTKGWTEENPMIL